MTPVSPVGMKAGPLFYSFYSVDWKSYIFPGGWNSHALYE